MRQIYEDCDSFHSCFYSRVNFSESKHCTFATDNSSKRCHFALVEQQWSLLGQESKCGWCHSRLDKSPKLAADYPSIKAAGNSYITRLAYSGFAMNMFKLICDSCWGAVLDSHNYNYALCLRCGGWKEMLVSSPALAPGSTINADNVSEITMKFGPCCHNNPILPAQEPEAREEIAIPIMEDPFSKPAHSEPSKDPTEVNKKKRKAPCPLNQAAKRQKLVDQLSQHPLNKAKLVPTRTTITTEYVQRRALPNRSQQEIDLVRMAQYNSFQERDFVITSRHHSSLTPHEELVKQVEEFRRTNLPKPTGRPRKVHADDDKDPQPSLEDISAKVSKRPNKGKSNSSSKSRTGSFTSASVSPTTTTSSYTGAPPSRPFHVHPLPDISDVTMSELDDIQIREMDDCLKKQQIYTPMPPRITVRETCISYYPQTGYGNDRESNNSEPDDGHFGRTYYSTGGIFVDCDGSGLVSID